MKAWNEAANDSYHKKNTEILVAMMVFVVICLSDPETINQADCPAAVKQEASAETFYKIP